MSPLEGKRPDKRQTLTREQIDAARSEARNRDATERPQNQAEQFKEKERREVGALIRTAAARVREMFSVINSEGDPKTKEKTIALAWQRMQHTADWANGRMKNPDGTPNENNRRAVEAWSAKSAAFDQTRKRVDRMVHGFGVVMESRLGDAVATPEAGAAQFERMREELRAANGIELAGAPEGYEPAFEPQATFLMNVAGDQVPVEVLFDAKTGAMDLRAAGFTAEAVQATQEQQTADNRRKEPYDLEKDRSDIERKMTALRSRYDACILMPDGSVVAVDDLENIDNDDIIGQLTDQGGRIMSFERDFDEPEDEYHARVKHIEQGVARFRLQYIEDGQLTQEQSGEDQKTPEPVASQAPELPENAAIRDVDPVIQQRVEELRRKITSGREQLERNDDPALRVKIDNAERELYTLEGTRWIEVHVAGKVQAEYGSAEERVVPYEKPGRDNTSDPIIPAGKMKEFLAGLQKSIGNGVKLMSGSRETGREDKFSQPRTTRKIPIQVKGRVFGVSTQWYEISTKPYDPSNPKKELVTINKVSAPK